MRFLPAFLLLGVFSSAFAQTKPISISMVFQDLPTVQLVHVMREACTKRGLVIDPAAKLDTVQTLHLPEMPCAQIEPIVREVLLKSGLVIEKRSGYDFLTSVKPVDERAGWEVVVYRPRNRAVSELSDMASFAIRQGQWSHRAKPIQVAADTPVKDNGSNGSSVSSAPSDVLIYNGPAAEARVVQALLEKLDTMPGQVQIRAGIYEFQSDRSEGSAITVMGKLLGGRVGFAVGQAGAGDSLTVSVGGLDAVMSLLDQDRRFRYVSRPKVTASDGQKARFFSGTDQRVTGSVLLDNNGRPIQSKETLSAGVTLEVTPRIRSDSIDLSIYEAVSSFVSTPGGEPTINKRDLTTRLSVRPGSVYIIGGLESNTGSTDKSGFFGWKVGQGAATSSTEIVLLLLVDHDV